METIFGPVEDEASWRLGVNFYLNCTRDVDCSIDIVLDALIASGQADRTVVIFTSDHGEMAGSHGLQQKGNLVYDENFHVPFVICHPDLTGGSRTDARPHRSARDAVLTAVEIVTTLDDGFWRSLGDPDGPERVQAGSLRPDWTKRGFLRGYTDDRYTFGRYFSPLEPNRPRTVERLLADSDVVLYDRQSDPQEQVNLANEPAHRELVSELSTRLEALSDAEIGSDTRAWVPERPRLVG
jgi:arylsulfatase A-like enzyme